MMRYIFIIFLLGIQIPSFAQKEKEVWYTWVDVNVSINGNPMRIISDQMMEITCCVSSSKYEKFSSKAKQWLESKIQTKIGDQSPFAKTKDKNLADKILEDALRKSQNSPNIRVVDYYEKCK